MAARGSFKGFQVPESSVDDAHRQQPLNDPAEGLVQIKRRKQPTRMTTSNPLATPQNGALSTVSQDYRKLNRKQVYAYQKDTQLDVNHVKRRYPKEFTHRDLKRIAKTSLEDLYQDPYEDGGYKELAVTEEEKTLFRQHIQKFTNGRLYIPVVGADETASSKKPKHGFVTPLTREQRQTLIERHAIDVFKDKVVEFRYNDCMQKVDRSSAQALNSNKTIQGIEAEYRPRHYMQQRLVQSNAFVLYETMDAITRTMKRFGGDLVYSEELQEYKITDEVIPLNNIRLWHFAFYLSHRLRNKFVYLHLIYFYKEQEEDNFCFYTHFYTLADEEKATQQYQKNK